MAEVVLAENCLEDDNSVDDRFYVIQWKALKEGKQMTRVLRELEKEKACAELKLVSLGG